MDSRLLDDLALAYQEAEREVFALGLTAESAHLTDRQRRLLLRLEHAAWAAHGLGEDGGPDRVSEGAVQQGLSSS